MNIKAHTTYVLTKSTLLRGPPEAGHHTVLDLIQVLHTLDYVSENVGAVPSGPKAPDPAGLSNIPLILFSQVAHMSLELLAGKHLPLSMSSSAPSGKGPAFMYSRLCLLGDLDRHSTFDFSLTVSQYETTGSDFLTGRHAWFSFKSLRRISRCSSLW